MAKAWYNLLIYHIMDRQIERCIQTYVQGRLIDIGCGTKPYEAMARAYATSHVGFDTAAPFNSQAKVDVIGRAYQIPVVDGAFDAALSTAALEHLNEPEAALRECHRVLKEGGVAIYTVPLFWHLHSEPWDYYRFTKYGLHYLFTKVGFEVVELKSLAGFWETMATMSCYYLERFNRKPLRYLRVIPMLGYLIQGVASVLGRLDRAEAWSWMYIVVARKRRMMAHPMRSSVSVNDLLATSDA